MDFFVFGTPLQRKSVQNTVDDCIECLSLTRNMQHLSRTDIYTIVKCVLRLFTFC